MFCWSKPLHKEVDTNTDSHKHNIHNDNKHLHNSHTHHYHHSHNYKTKQHNWAWINFNRHFYPISWIGTLLTYFSSLAMSPCWESSRISGRLVIMSRWISTGATDTICISLLLKSYTHTAVMVVRHLSQQCHNLAMTNMYVCYKGIVGNYDVHRNIFITGLGLCTLPSTIRSSHFNWFIMRRGTLRPSSLTL